MTTNTHSIAKWWRNFSEIQTQKSSKNSKFSRNEQYFPKDSYKKRHVTILNLVWHDNSKIVMPKKVYLSFYRFIKTMCKKFEYFSFSSVRKNTWSVTFLILKYFTTRHEVFYSNVDNFQISKSTPEFNITQMIIEYMEY